MRIPRFYESQRLKVGENIDLSTNVHRHGVQVLRLKQDNSIILFDGRGGEYHATLSHVEKRQSQALIVSHNPISRESTLNTQLCLTLIKPDKMDFAIQKSVELGVTSIQPIATERSVIRLNDKRIDKKMDHWQGVIISACEQSGRTALPTLHTPLSLDDYLAQDHQQLRLAMLPGDHPPLKALPQPDIDQAIAIIVGPEGGYSDDEQALLANNAQPLSLGTLIQRSETAAISTLATIQQLWG